MVGRIVSTREAEHRALQAIADKTSLALSGGGVYQRVLHVRGPSEPPLTPDSDAASSSTQGAPTQQGTQAGNAANAASSLPVDITNSPLFIPSITPAPAGSPAAGSAPAGSPGSDKGGEELNESLTYL